MRGMAELESWEEKLCAPPPRLGSRPRTGPGLPHLQLDQWPPEAILRELLDGGLSLPHVRSRQSRMASPHSVALTLPDRFAGGPPGAFIDDHEFCHLHPAPEGSIHLTLPDEIRRSAVEMGWAEPHPAARMGALTEALVMVYAPRNRKELAVVLELIGNSYEFARFGTGASVGAIGATMERA